MGQAQPPVSLQTQQLNASVAVVANAQGIGVFKFQSPATGFIQTGTLTCPTAPTVAQFSAAIGATSWGSWGGNSVYGPVQAVEAQQLVVTASGLTPGTTYDLEWNGSSDAADSVQPIYPDANASALTASISGVIAGMGAVDFLASGGPTALVAGTSTELPGALGVTALHAYGALVFVATYSAAPPAPLFVIGQRTPSGGGLVLNFPQIELLPDGASPIAVLPYACQAGDQVIVAVNALNSGNISWALYGCTEVIQTVPLRPDGRSQPIGLFSGTSTIGAAGLNTIVPAPSAPFGILLKSAHLSALAVAGVVISLAATINGVGVNLNAIGGAMSGVSEMPISDNGQLLDPGTGLFLSYTGGAGGFGAGSVIYDLVP